MAEGEIKAKLVLVTDGGVSGSGGGRVFTDSEERLFRQEQREANKTTSRFLPLMAMGGLGSAIGLAGSAATILGSVVGEMQKKGPSGDNNTVNLVEELPEALKDLNESATESAENMKVAGEENIENWDDVSSTLNEMSAVIGTESKSAGNNLKMMSAIIDATPDSFIAMAGAIGQFIQQITGYSNDVIKLRQSMGSFVKDPLNSSNIVDFYDKTLAITEQYRNQQGTITASSQLNQSGRNAFNTNPYDLINQNYANK